MAEDITVEYMVRTMIETGEYDGLYDVGSFCCGCYLRESEATCHCLDSECAFGYRRFCIDCPPFDRDDCVYQERDTSIEFCIHRDKL